MKEECWHFAMTPLWENGELTYTCCRCGISVHLSQRDLGRMVQRRLKKRGMYPVRNVAQYRLLADTGEEA